MFWPSVIDFLQSSSSSHQSTTSSSTSPSSIPSHPSKRTVSPFHEFFIRGGVAWGLLSLLLAALAVFSYSQFLDCDYLVIGWLYTDEWSNSAGFTDAQWVYYLVATYVLPASIVLILMFASKSFTNLNEEYFTIKIIMYLIVISLSTAWVYYGYELSSSVLDCLPYFCLGDYTTKTVDVTSGGKFFIGIIYVFLGVCYFVLFSILIGMTILQHRPTNEASKAATTAIATHDVDESSPLLSSTNDNNKSTIKSTIKSTNKNDKDIKTKPMLYSSISSSSSDYRNNGAFTLAYERDSKNRTHVLYKNTIALALVFGLLYPLLLFASMLLPTGWSGFTVYSIESEQASEPDPASMGSYLYFSTGNKLVAKLYPDILMYYGFIYIVVGIALGAHIYPPLLRFLSKRPLWLNSSILSLSLGQFILSLSLVFLFIGQFCYFYYDHGWDGYSITGLTTQERAARALGQLANLVFGLLLLPASKNSVWTIVFGVSWDNMIHWHKVLGYTFLLVIAAHMFTWWTVFAQQDSFPHDIFNVPLTYHSDNFTVPLAQLTFFIMIPIFGVFTYYKIRRWSYELFYFTHLFSVVVVLVVLWHASMSWYYLTAGLVLWVVDVFLRILNVVTLKCDVITSKAVTISGGGSKSCCVGVSGGYTR